MGVRLRLLLDTHALLWALAEPEKLSRASRGAIEDPNNELWVSAVSLFEISTKVRIGKLQVPASLLKRWQWSVECLSARLLQVSGSHAVLAGGLPVDHRDPFDRLLAAQAIEEGLTLVSCDSAFQEFSGLAVLW